VRRPDGLARRYAKALFALARDHGRAEALGHELDAVARVVTEHPDLARFLARPGDSAAAKQEALAAVAGRVAQSPLIRDFAALLAARRRAGHLGTISAAYGELVDADLGRVRARVRSAVPLTTGERAEIAARLGRALGGRQVLLEEEQDPEVLAGFVAEVGSLVLDGSLDGQLARMRERLAGGRG
jgi:F-type H+-transporting ATPase subunit delta